MKKVFSILFVYFFIVLSSFAQNSTTVCSYDAVDLSSKEKFINKFSGISFITRNIAESVIERQLSKNLDSDVKANLKLFSVAKLKKGEFKSLKLDAKKVVYKAFSASDIVLETICPVNKILLKNKKLYFPENIDFSYTASITNDDLHNVVNSKEFQDELARSSLSFRGVNGLVFNTPKVEMADNQLYFTLPVTSFLLKKPYNIKFRTDIEIKNNKIVLRNITFNSKRNIISYDIFAPVIDAINPLAFELNSINAKLCNIEIVNAQISGNVIKTNGILKIKKNYSEGNE